MTICSGRRILTFSPRITRLLFTSFDSCSDLLKASSSNDRRFFNRVSETRGGWLGSKEAMVARMAGCRQIGPRCQNLGIWGNLFVRIIISCNSTATVQLVEVEQQMKGLD